MLAGLAPGEHHLYVHETGDCGALAGATARRSVDFGAVSADASGAVNMSLQDAALRVDGVLGRAILVASAGDTGRASPVACAVIQPAGDDAPGSAPLPGVARAA
jgi:Cu/Zn superoxide dismutase